jgi:hypothetical protein
MAESRYAAELRDAQRRLRELQAQLQQFTTKTALTHEQDWGKRYLDEGTKDLERFANHS